MSPIINRDNGTWGVTVWRHGSVSAETSDWLAELTLLCRIAQFPDIYLVTIDPDINDRLVQLSYHPGTADRAMQLVRQLGIGEPDIPDTHRLGETLTCRLIDGDTPQSDILVATWTVQLRQGGD